MSIYFNQQITTYAPGVQPFGLGCMPMPPMAPRPCTLFGPAPFMPVPMYPAMGCYPMMSDSMAAGFFAGAVLGMPGAVQAIGDGLKWGYNNIIKPVWNGVIKPVGKFIYNDILKPIGSGLKWLWDHSLGWCLKKLEGATSKSKSEDDDEVDEVDETNEVNESSDSAKAKESVEESSEE